MPRTGRPPRKADHGDILCYQRGCRCEPCRQSKRDYSNAHPHRNLTHGKPSTYTNGGCRCIQCQTAYKAWRKARPHHIHVNAIKATKQCSFNKRKYVASLKTNPCTDCNQSFPPECMDFDHVRGVKLAMVSRTPRKHLEAEIAKCDLVCANCHRIRTRKRRQGGPLDPKQQSAQQT